MDIDKINEIVEKITELFISDFELMNDSKDKINNYLILLGVNNIYDYNNFCIDMINISTKKLNDFSDTEFISSTAEVFITDILEEMVKFKIRTSDLSEEEIMTNLMKLELDAFMVKNKK